MNEEIDNNRRVLIVGNFLSSIRGTRGVGEELSDRLETAGWHVVRTSRFPNRLARLYDMLFVTFSRRKHYEVAVVEVYSGPSFFWAEIVCFLLRALRKVYILNLHGGNLPNFEQRWPWRVHTLLKSANAVVTPSRYLQDHFKSRCHALILLPNAVDLSRYPFRDRTPVKAQLAWLRAFHTLYDPLLAVKTLAALKGEFPQIHLTMFGPDNDDGSYQAAWQTAERLGVANWLSTPGSIPKADVSDRLAEYDIYLNTTTAESFGVSVVEAAALGLCIVTTSVGELPYIWTHEHDALLVPPNDSEAMANAVRRILTEPGLAERLSRNARTRSEQYDWCNILPQWENLLGEVMSKRIR